MVFMQIFSQLCHERARLGTSSFVKTGDDAAFQSHFSIASILEVFSSKHRCSLRVRQHHLKQEKYILFNLISFINSTKR